MKAAWLRVMPAGEGPLALATLLALSVLYVVRCSSLTLHELSIDEAATYHVATHALPELVRLAIESHSQPPLFYVLVHFLLPLADSELVLRGISWVCLLALVWVVVLGVRELSLGARGLFGLLLVSSDYAYSLLIVRPYALCALTSFLASLLLLRALETPQRPRLLIGYGVALAAALGTAAFNAWLFVAHGLLLLVVLASQARSDGALPALKKLAWLVGILGPT
jgi:uncharacterized membrane protein